MHSASLCTPSSVFPCLQDRKINPHRIFAWTIAMEKSTCHKSNILLQCDVEQFRCIAPFEAIWQKRKIPPSGFVQLTYSGIYFKAFKYEISFIYTVGLFFSDLSIKKSPIHIFCNYSLIKYRRTQVWRLLGNGNSPDHIQWPDYISNPGIREQTSWKS